MFVTLSSNVLKTADELVMLTGETKHVGIFSGGTVWNYNNTNEKVVGDSLSSFISKFSSSYGKRGTVTFYYGEFIK
jgi:hypothetical protein